MAEVSKREGEFPLKWRMGARSAVLISMLASRFVSDIELCSGGLWIDAKLCVAVLLLDVPRSELPDGSFNFGPDADQKIKLRVTGADAAAAFAALSELLTIGERVVQCRNTDCISSAILIAYDEATINYSCSNYHAWSVHRATGRTTPTRILLVKPD